MVIGSHTMFSCLMKLEVVGAFSIVISKLKMLAGVAKLLFKFVILSYNHTA